MGCSALGWLRVGWGERLDAPRVPADPRIPSVVAAKLPSDPTSSQTPTLECRVKSHATLDAAMMPIAGLRMWSSFLALAPPKVPPGWHGHAIDLLAALGHEATGRLYLWGPQVPADAIDLATFSPELRPHVAVRWSWPFGDASTVMTSAPAPAPTSLGAMMDQSAAGATAQRLSLIAGDSPGEALLVLVDAGASEVFELSSGRPLLAWRAESTGAKGASSASLPLLAAAVRAAGHWYFASTSPTGDPGPPRTVVWKVENGVARRLATVPRFVPEGHHTDVHLARREDGRAIALVVGTDPRQASDGDRGVWALPLDLASQQLGGPERLGPLDLAQPSLLVPCGPPGSAPGWVVDLELGLRPRLRGSSEPLVLSSTLARLHVRSAAPDRADGAADASPAESSPPACVERMTGVAHGKVQSSLAASLVSGEDDHAPRFPIVLESDNWRATLSCRVPR